MKKFGKVLKKKLKRLLVKKTLNGGENIYNLKKNKFESNDDLPLNKHIKLHLLTIIIRSVFSEDSKFQLQLFLDEALCVSIKMLQYQKIDVSEGIGGTKTSASEECELCTIDFLEMSVLNLKNMFAMDVMIY